MYRAFQNVRTVTKTVTNGRLFLDDPKSKNGEFKRYVSVIFDGTMEVITQPQVITIWEDVGPLYALPWWVDNMPSEGFHPDFGTIKLTGNPALLSTGVIRQNVSGQQFPATLDAAVYQVFDIPGYGRLHNKYPVVVQGTVDAIPPFHTACGCRSALLFDDHNHPRGIIGGRTLTLMGND